MAPGIGGDLIPNSGGGGGGETGGGGGASGSGGGGGNSAPAQGRADAQGMAPAAAGSPRASSAAADGGPARVTFADRAQSARRARLLPGGAPLTAGADTRFRQGPKPGTGVLSNSNVLCMGRLD